MYTLFSFTVTDFSLVTTVKQNAVVVTSFLSLSIGFVAYRDMLEGKEWTFVDMVIDFLWNALSVSPRVIALASVRFIPALLVLWTSSCSSCHWYCYFQWLLHVETRKEPT